MFDETQTLRDQFYLVRPDGTQVTLRIRIGYPVERDGAWTCPCEIEGLDPQYPDARGVSALQAMCLALKLVRGRLISTMEKGGRLYMKADHTERLTPRLINAIFGVYPDSERG